MQPSPVLGQFTSAATAGDVYLELGFIPDFIRVFIDIGGTSSNVLEFWNDDNLSMVPATSAVPTSYLLTTGTTGVRTKVTTAGQIPVPYAGGDKIASAEASTTDPKHVTPDGAVAAANHITAAGVMIPKEAQVNSGINFFEAYRVGR